MVTKVTISIADDVYEDIEDQRGETNRSEYYEYLIRTNPVFASKKQKETKQNLERGEYNEVKR